MTLKPAVLTAREIEVACPYCGDVSAAPSGSNLWDSQELEDSLGNPQICYRCGRNFRLSIAHRPLFSFALEVQR